MFDRQNDPLSLQSQLETWICIWHGYRRPWYGISPEKLALTQLPQPLAWLYGFAGEWAGRYYWSTLFGNQDCLVRFEDLELRQGKLVFVCENQCVWEVATEPVGDDPPVWVSIDGEPWLLVDESLTRFLVTFILHETAYGCQHLGSCTNAIAKVQEAGMHVSPLWLNHPYPAVFNTHLLGFDTEGFIPIDFHIANGTYLILDNCHCATNCDCPWIELPSIFKPKAVKQSSNGTHPFQPIPEHIQVPSAIRRNQLENLIHIHETEMKYHQGRSELYRAMLSKMDTQENDA